MPRDEAWPSSPQHHVELMGRYYSEPLKCVACAAASEAREKFEAQPHDEHGIHYVIRDGENEFDDEDD